MGSGVPVHRLTGLPAIGLLALSIGCGPLSTQSTQSVEPRPGGDAGVLPTGIVLLVDHVTDDLGKAYADVAFSFLQMPLDHLGMRLVEHPVGAGPPEDLDPARVRAVGTWFSTEVALPEWVWPWLSRQDPALRVLHFGSLLPLARDDGGERLRRHLQRFGLGFDPEIVVDPGRITVECPQPELYPFESKPVYECAHLGPWNLDDGNTVWVATHDAQGPGRPRAPVVTGRWGGIGLHPWFLRMGGADQDRRWYADPFAFCRRALGLDGVPAPDPCVRNGRRVFVLHVDGDGFESVSTVAPEQTCGRVFRDRIVDRWRIPMTIGFIVASLTDEFAPAEPTAGMRLARSIAERPWVELASHTVLHPLDWRRPLLPRSVPRSVVWYEGLGGYRHDMVAEVRESVAFLDRWIAPAGRRCRMVLWSGEANPPAAAIAAASAAGCLNMNGGLFRWDALHDSVGFVTPWGRRIGGQWQVFAAGPNENLYPGFFTTMPGAFAHVSTTIERTGSPRILKPANVYVHFYSAEHPARLAALEALLERWVEREETVPVLASAYAAAVRDAQSGCTVARTGTGFRFEGFENCRTVRIDGGGGAVDWEHSSGLLGARRLGDSLYLHLARPCAEVAFAAGAAPWLHVEQADCDLDEVVPGPRELRFVARGAGGRHVVVAGAAAGAELCLQVDGGERRARCDADGRAEVRLREGGAAEVRVWLP